jgi:hypothetical protein
VPECGQDEFGTHTARTGHPDDPDVGRVLHAADACQVGGTVTAPVAQESRYLRLPVIHFQLLFFLDRVNRINKIIEDHANPVHPIKRIH